MNPADSVLDDLFAQADQTFRDSAITREKGLFLRKLASDPRVANTIEVGCANAISTLFLCSATGARGNATHIAIDPYQTSEYHGKGIDNVRRAGIDWVRLVEEPSELALPRLLAEGRVFDLALIDGLHTLDQTLLDFYYLDRMLRVGGVIVLDDVHQPAVSRVVRYISKYPNYELAGVADRRGLKRQSLSAVKTCLAAVVWPLRMIFGDSLLREFCDESLLDVRSLWRLDLACMVAFRKTSEYQRSTTWYRGM